MKVMYVPHAAIIKLPSSKRTRKAVVLYSSDDYYTSPKRICDWMNKELSLQVCHLLGVSAVVILFSFLFIPGKGLVHLLQWRGSYLRVCLIILFLCLACIPYVIIRKPVPYTEVINIFPS